MKKICTIFAAILLTASIFAQAPQKMSYQAVIRNSSNALVTSSAVGMKVSILQGSAAGSPVFVETHTPTTNANGLASFEIGGGAAVTGTMAGIDWSAGPYFIKTETDPTGGTSYTITGTSQLMSVPYALFSGNGTPGPAGPQGMQGLPGAAGTNGTNGAIGSAGLTGAAGTNGTNGAIGATGLTGATGPQGPIGLTGPAGLLSSGTIAGNTPYCDGSQWVVNNSNIYNNGAGVGIGTTNPLGKFHVNNDVSGADSSFVVTNAGNVGVGTSNPLSTLHVLGDLILQDKDNSPHRFEFRDSTGQTRCSERINWSTTATNFDFDVYSPTSSTSANFRFFRNSNTTGIKNVSFCRGNNTNQVSALIGIDGVDSYFQTHGGNFGIGTDSPARTLHVNAVMRLEPIATAPTSPAKGDMYFDSTLNKLRVYDGTVWQSCW